MSQAEPKSHSDRVKAYQRQNRHEGLTFRQGRRAMTKWYKQVSKENSRG